MKSRALVSFVLGKCIKMTILVFIFDLHMFVKLMSVVRLFDKAVQVVLQWYSKSHRVLVNHIKHIQRMVREVCKVVVIHCTPADQIVEQQERCSKYSQQAIGFAISTYSGFLVSPELYSTGDSVVKIATSAAFFVAITADLVSWRMKPRWGRALVYISSFHLLLMTFVIFISFDKDYGYPILLVLLVTIAAILFQRNIWPAEMCQQSMDNGTAISTQDLDFMFDLSSLILNLDSIVTMIITISGHFPSGLNKYEAVKTAGFLFFSTIVLSLYLIMVATVRTVALTVSSKYLDVLLMILLVSALITTSITFYFFDQTLLPEWEVPT